MNHSNKKETEKKVIEQKLDRIEAKLASLEESLAIFKYGAQEIKKKHMEEYKAQGKLHKIDFQHKLFALIRQDANLSEPLRKVMEFMISQFDDSKHNFKDLTFSQIRKEAPVSGGKLSGYLNELVERGLLIKRDDGYHSYYKTNYQAYEEDNTAPDFTEKEQETAEQTA